jgi:Putative rhamnosyl transferase
VRHYILTRSAYGPDVPIEVNRYRLDLLRGVTVPSLASQTSHDATWLVLVDEADPLKEEREAAYRDCGFPLLMASAGDMERNDRRDRPWTTSWRDNIDWSDATLTTRIDDDDAFAPWAIKAFRDYADRWSTSRHGRQRRVFVMPLGYRVSGGKVDFRRDRANQFTSLYAPSGDRCCIMDMNHTSQRRLAQLVEISREPGWLWLRHGLARSALSRASNIDKDGMQPIGDDVRGRFNVDWNLIASLP